MTIIGYVYQTEDAGQLVTQITHLKEYPVDKIIVESIGKKLNNGFYELEKAMEYMHHGDQVVVYSLEAIDQSLLQFNYLFNKLDEKGIEFIVLTSLFSQKEYMEAFKYLAKKEQELVADRTVEKLNVAKNKGKVVGRPTISEDKIEKINFLYKQRNYSYKEIAKKCNVSLGTVQKYIKK